MKSVRYTGILSAGALIVAGITASMSLNNFSLLAISIACLFGLKTLYNMDRRASLKARKTSLQVSSIANKLDRLLQDIAAEKGVVSSEVRGLRVAVSDMEARFNELGDRRLVTGLRSIDIAKRELEERISVGSHVRPAQQQ